MRTWTLKDRKRQACIARRDHPWTRSTGPRTHAGKNISKMNALKRGFHSKLYLDLWRARRSYNRFIGRCLPFFTFKQLRKHMINEFELLQMLAAWHMPGVGGLYFSRDWLRKWLKEVTKDTLYVYKSLSPS